MTAATKLPVADIFITMGDPAGVGPEIIAKALAAIARRPEARFVVIGDEAIIRKELSASGLSDRDDIDVLPHGEPLTGVDAGKPNDAGAESSLRSLEKAVELMMAPEDATQRALVTAPICKASVARIHPGFTGHTEFLQQAYGADLVTMAFVGDNLRVVPVTRHTALRDVPLLLNSELIFRTIVQVVDSRFIMTGREDAKIIVTALNPHAGEGGRMGTEEKDLIEPAISRAREIYSGIEGPVPSDVAFYKAAGRPETIVIAMYHDQCLGPFKMLDFTNGVNMTLGLGHIRTSPDHGTAFDIAGKGVAEPGSMIRAIELALKALNLAR